MTPSRTERLLTALLPARQLDAEARAELQREGREVMLARARTWGPVLLILQAAYIGAVSRLPATTSAQWLWRRDYVRIDGALELLDAAVLACVALYRGPARAVADRTGPLFQLFGLFAYALLGVNAQRLHGSVGQFGALVFAAVYLFRAPQGWYLGALAVSGATLVAGVLALQPDPILRHNNVLTVLGFMVAGVLFSSMNTASLVKDLLSRRLLRTFNVELEAMVEAKTRELRQVALRLDDVLETERRRLARELHDDLGQELTGMRFEVEALLAYAADERPRAGLGRIAGALERSHQSVRTILESLRPRILVEEGLEEAIRWLARQFHQRGGCACAVAVVLYDEPDARVGLVAFRIAQESLTNVARHAGASRVDVSLAADDHAIRLEITDDGASRSTHTPEPGRGMTGMRERALSVGGTLEVTPVTPQGMRVLATLPLRPSFPSD